MHAVPVAKKGGKYRPALSDMRVPMLDSIFFFLMNYSYDGVYIILPSFSTSSIENIAIGAFSTRIKFLNRLGMGN